MSSAAASLSSPPRTWLDGLLRAFADVRAGEGLTAVLFGSALFVGLFGYYVLKTVREPWLLATGGAELKSYATGAQAVLLMGILPLYARLARRVERRRLVLGTSLAHLFAIELFSVLAWLRVPYVGLVFYVWLGIFVLTSVAQVWSFANDLYAPEKGARLFPLVAIGAPLGSALGAALAARLFSGADAIASLLHVAAAFVLAQLVLLAVIARRPEAARAPSAPIDTETSLGLVLASPYLRLVAALFVVLNLVNTTGEYLLSRAVIADADAVLAAALAHGPVADPAALRADHIRAVYGDFYFLVNAGAVLLQALVASRLVRVAGLRGALFVLPLVALGAYAAVGVGVGFLALRALKIAENATDYSIQNTARAVLWLPTSRAEKYVGKQTVDTFFVRVGDVLSALLVLGFGAAGVLPDRGLAALNVAFAALALGLAGAVASRHRALLARAA